MVSLNKLTRRCWFLGVFVFVTGCGTTSLLGLSAEDELQAGIALFNQGEYAEAIVHLKRALELDPQLTEAYLYIGRAFFNQGEWLEAVSYFRNAYYNLPLDRRKEVVSSFMDSLIKGALGLFKKGDYTNAIALLKEAVGVDPRSALARGELVDVLLSHGRDLMSQGRYNDAIETFSDSLKFAPGNLDSYLGMAKAFFHQGDYSKALEAVQRVLSDSPDNSQAQALFRRILSGG